MKFLTALTVTTLITATSAAANIGDVDAALETMKPQTVALTHPQNVPARVFAAGETCVLPLTQLVAIPASFTTTGDQIELACVVQ